LRSLLEQGSGCRLQWLLPGRKIGEEVEEIFRREILAQSINAAGEQELLDLFNRCAFS
jgi:hypothetical protein